MAPHLLSLAKDVKLSFYTLPTGNRTLARCVAVHYTTAAPRQLLHVFTWLSFGLWNINGKDPHLNVSIYSIKKQHKSHIRVWASCMNAVIFICLAYTYINEMIFVWLIKEMNEHLTFVMWCFLHVSKASIQCIHCSNVWTWRVNKSFSNAAINLQN